MSPIASRAAPRRSGGAPHSVPRPAPRFGARGAGRLALRFGALGYLTVLLLVPVGLILWRTFSPGLATFWAWISTPAAVSALNLSLVIVAIVVPLNAVFGVAVALALARGRFRGKAVLQALVDLPFAVSPVVVGTALILLWGAGGWLGFLQGWGIQVIYAVPGMVLATLFVTLPFVVREVEPVLVEIGEDQEQAAATLGAGRWQTFRRITLPAIRWGLTYGIVLTVSRALGEFGAVIMVSSGLAGHTQTLTLLVEARHQRGDEYGAYAAATLLMIVAVAVLALMTALSRRRVSKR